MFRERWKPVFSYNSCMQEKIDPRDVMPLKFTENRDNELLLASLPDGMSEEIEKFLEIS